MTVTVLLRAGVTKPSVIQAARRLDGAPATADVDVVVVCVPAGMGDRMLERVQACKRELIPAAGRTFTVGAGQ